jgi:hypothetical protein
LFWKALAAAAVVAAVLVPAASARSHARVRLSVLPLPKSSLGSAAHGLAIAHDGGVLSNSAVAERTFSGVSPTTFRKLGRITGYGLDYGDEATGLQGVDEIWTSVDEYKSARDARRGVAFWRKDDALVTELNQGGLSVTNGLFKVPKLGSARFGDLTNYSASNIANLATFDEEVADGRYVVDVTVAAGIASEASALDTKLAKKLDARLHLALKGRLHARPVKLPGKVKAGPPTGGPDLSAMAFATSDFPSTDQPSVFSSGYEPGPPALSVYTQFILFGAGSYDFLGQEMLWYRTANEAAFTADVENAFELSLPDSEPLDLSAVGDGAQGALVNDPSGGEGQVVFSTGQLADLFFIDGEGLIDTGDLTSFAQTAAGKINAAYTP